MLHVVAGRAAYLPARTGFTSFMKRTNSTKASAGAVRLVLIGDVHNHWNKDDVTALKFLQPDAALFVGDFGEEVVDLVHSIKQQMDAEGIPAAYVLGNHDAWHSLHKKDLDSNQDERLAGTQAQLKLLGSDHVGYSSKRFPHAGVSVVGARPFSAGGSSWTRAALFHKIVYGVDSMQSSAERVMDSISRVPTDDTVVIMAHNGPAGVGSDVHSICGKDWSAKGGDHGDPDLRMVLNMAHAEGKPVPLVIFGHMHHILYHQSGFRQMVHIEQNGTVLLNCAVVPRWSSEPSAEGQDAVKLHQFTTVELTQGTVRSVSQVWVAVAGKRCWIADSREIVRTESLSDDMLVRSYVVPDQSDSHVISKRGPLNSVWMTAAHTCDSPVSKINI